MSIFVQRRLAGGQTLRYHTLPHVGGGQNVAAHCWRAMVLMETFWPEVSKTALLHVLHHDTAEQTLGDIPAPAKWMFPELHAVYGEAEEEVGHSLEILRRLTEEEKLMCGIVDMVECVDHVANRIMQGDKSFDTKVVYWNGRKSLFKKYDAAPVFGPASAYLAYLHELVKKACPEID
jgi:hypothetical protein